MQWTAYLPSFRFRPWSFDMYTLGWCQNLSCDRDLQLVVAQSFPTCGPWMIKWSCCELKYSRMYGHYHLKVYWFISVINALTEKKSILRSIILKSKLFRSNLSEETITWNILILTCTKRGTMYLKKSKTRLPTNAVRSEELALLPKVWETLPKILFQRSRGKKE